MAGVPDCLAVAPAAYYLQAVPQGFRKVATAHLSTYMGAGCRLIAVNDGRQPRPVDYQAFASAL